MEPSCSHLNNDDKKIATSQKYSESNTAIKATEEERESDVYIDSKSERNGDHQKTDEIERGDFEEENRLIKHCSEMVVDNQKFPTSSANFSSAPDLQKVSTLSSVQMERIRPGCSAGHILSCNSTTKDVLKVRKVLFPNETETNEKSKSNKFLSKSRNEFSCLRVKSFNEIEYFAKKSDKISMKRDGLLEDKLKAVKLHSQICSIHKSPISSQPKRIKSNNNFGFSSNSGSSSSLCNIQKKVNSLLSYSSENLFSNDSNTTIRNMIKGRRVLFPEETEPVKKHQDAWNNKSPSEVEDKKLPIRGLKDFDEQVTDVEVGVCAKSNEVGAIETSKLLDLKSILLAGPSDRTSSLSIGIKDKTALSSSSIQQLCEGNALESQFDESSYHNPISTVCSSKTFLQDLCGAYSDEDNGSVCCLCPSSHEAEDDSLTSEPTNQSDSSDDSRVWRKRMCDLPCAAGSCAAKKFCPDVSIPLTTHECSCTANLPVTNSDAPAHQSPSELEQWLNRFNSWSNCERLQAIDALISRSAASQVRHMMDAIEPLFTRDFISQLPRELSLTVLSYLEPEDLLRASRTCRYWRFLASDTLLWKQQCRRIGLICECGKSGTDPQRCPRFHKYTWQALYKTQYLTEKNWIRGTTNDHIFVKGHDDHVITCLQFYRGRIVSGSDDNTLKVWCASSGHCLQTLVGHTGGVWSSQMSKRLVISGSTDRTVRIWDINTGECLNILSGHTSTVRCLALHQDRVVSGSRDMTLRVWSVVDGRCERVLTGHVGAVRCVQFNGNLVVSGAYDTFIKVWNVENGDCIHTLAGHTNRVYSIQFDGVHVVSGSLDTSIRVWDVVSGACKHVLTGHQSLTSGMELRSNVLVSGNADSTVKVWDINTGHCLHTLSGPNKHQSAVTCLQSTKRFVITSSDDGTVKLWDLRTGEFIRNLVQLSSGGSGGVVWRIRTSVNRLICAAGSRNGTEETKLIIIDFSLSPKRYTCYYHH